MGNWRMDGQPVPFTLPRNMVYPALLPLMRTSRLPVIYLHDAPANLNGLVRFAERRNLVSARVSSHFKRSLPRLSFCAYHDMLLGDLYLQEKTKPVHWRLYTNRREAHGLQDLGCVFVNVCTVTSDRDKKRLAECISLFIIRCYQIVLYYLSYILYYYLQHFFLHVSLECALFPRSLFRT